MPSFFQTLNTAKDNKEQRIKDFRVGIEPTHF